MKKLDLLSDLFYDAKCVRAGILPSEYPKKRLPTMKLAVRILALSIVVAGGVAAALTPKSTPILPSHQTAAASFPIPECTPGFPTCPQTPPPHLR
jgi:hypothetical protein